MTDLGAKIAGDYGEEYRQQIDEEHRHSNKYCDALVAQGILAIAIPEESARILNGCPCHISGDYSSRLDSDLRLSPRKMSPKNTKNSKSAPR